MNINLLTNLIKNHFIKLNEINGDYQKNIIQIPRICNNIVLKNANNSCYLDSLFVALFHHDNIFIQNAIFKNEINKGNKDLENIANKILDELINIYNLIANTLEEKEVQICVNIRKLFNNYKDLYMKLYPKNTSFAYINYERDQTEPVEILNILTIIFNFNSIVKLNTSKWGTNYNIEPDINSIIKNKPINSKKHEETFTQYIHYNDLLGKKLINIKDFFPVRTDITHFEKEEYFWRPDDKDPSIKYSTKIEQIEIIDTSLLFIHIKRLIKNNENGYGDEEEILNDTIKLDTKVIPEKKIILKSGKILKLYSIIIQNGINIEGHYICLYNCNDVWYKYDDIGPKIDKIGTINDIINHDTYLKNCTDFLYIEKPK